MNILVTGGSGYIGSHTCVSLLEKNFKLTIVDSNVNSSHESINRIKIILGDKVKNRIIFKKGDIRDEFFLKEIFSKAIKENNPIEGVIHFAGLKSVEESIKDPLIYWDVNVKGSIVLFRVMELFNCNLIVFSSSATVYGNAETIPIQETCYINPTNTYGHTKITTEYILQDIFRSSKNKWRICNLRYFNPIGAHSSGLIGENPFNYPNNLFPIICGVVQGKYRQLSIYGNDWPTKDGTCIRDYIHVMDLAESHCNALEYLLKNKSQLITLNIGRGVGTSVLELMNTFKEVNNCDIPYDFSSKRSGDVPVLVANNKLSSLILNWKPKRSLKDMCIDGWRWQIMNPNGY